MKPHPPKQLAQTLLVALLLQLIAGCGGVEVEHYAQESPKLDLQAFFDRPMDAWGVFQKRNGEVARRFYVRMTPTWKDGVVTLDEQFTYSDGEKQRRVWTLRQVANGSWRGTADDVKGEAIGKIAGNALHWRYVMKLPVDGKVYEVDFDDWMWQMDDKTMLNRSAMRKFGFTLGEVTLFFRKS